MVAGQGRDEEPEIESILREINQACWTIGYTGQSPERLKVHMRNMNVFDVKTLRAKGGIDKETGYDLDGDYFGLPWPCYGTPEMKHPARRTCTTPSRHVMDGGGNFRANFGVERDGVNLLAEDGSHSKGADITTGYPEFDHVLLKKLGWWDELTDAEKKAAEGKNWKTDLSGGIIRVVDEEPRLPPVRQREGARGGLELPRRRCRSTASRSTRRGPTWSPSTRRTTTRRRSGACRRSTRACRRRTRDIGKEFPLIMTRGRLVEYEGGGEETRSNPWLAELQQENFVEINPKDANDRGIRDGEYVWVQVADRRAASRCKALVTERVGPGTVVHAVPLLGPVAGQGHARRTTPRAPRRSCAARRSTPRRPTATTP